MRTPLTVAVLLPCALGYCPFVRWPRQRLRACSRIVDPLDLRDAMRSLGASSSWAGGAQTSSPTLS